MERHPLPARSAVFLLGAVAFAWGTGWPVTKALLAYLPPLWTTTIRTAIAVVTLFAISGLRRHVVVPKRADLPVVLNVAFLHMVAFAGLIAIGLQFVPAGRSVVLGYTTPLWVMIGARLFLGEALTPARLAGVGLGMLGLLLLFNPLALDWSDRNAVIGNALVLLAAFCWAASILHVRAHRWVSGPFELVPWQALLATGVLAVLAYALEGPLHMVWSPRVIVLLLYGGIIGIALPYWATMTVNRSLPAITTSLGLLGVPVVGVACSAVALDEPLTITLLTAMILICGGIAVGAVVQSRREPAGESADAAR